ncbi:hypothetical protein BJ165DRAFT_1405415 [Panaeolus papilionaceus]|nr:hypothetical protein BJ165DRAFT_1405415 [Panaeolus papilionaceus]
MIPCFTSNAAHEVLRNPSLASEILSFVTQGQDIKRQRGFGLRQISHNLKTCLAVALSCTWLLEPALDEIWSRLTDLLPIVMLIPGLDNMCGKIFTRKALSQSQIKRIEYHARRVRSLDILLHDNPRPLAWAEASLFVQLLVLLRGNALLPRLSYLSIQGATSPDQATLFSAMLPLLPCSNLQHIHLYPTDGPKISPHFVTVTAPPISQFLHALADMPNQRLETLFVVSQAAAFVMGILRQFPALTFLSISAPLSPQSIDYSIFRHISTLENLRTLNIVLWNQTTTNVAANDTNHALTLHPIQYLGLISDIQSHIRVLRGYKFPSLAKARFSIVVPSGMLIPPQIWQELWDEFVHLLSDGLKPLKVLGIRHQNSSDTSIPTLGWHTFTPILRLKNLTCLILSGLRIVSFSHLECITLCNALPHLEYLELDITEITPTLLHFLVEIGTRLLCLKTLSIPLDWRTVGPHLHPDSSSTPKHPLSSITIIGIPAAHATELRTLLEQRNISAFLHDECKRLANFLFALFPDVAFSISPAVNVPGLDNFVMHDLAELRSR